MKTSIETVRKHVEFEPFAVTIEVESVNEARLLWHKLATGYSVMQRQVHPSNCTCLLPPNRIGMYNPWDVLDDYMKDHQLKD